MQLDLSLSIEESWIIIEIWYTCCSFALYFLLKLCTYLRLCEALMALIWHAHNQQHCVCNQTQIGIYSENATPPDRHPLQWLDAWGKFVVVFGMTMTAASFTLILLELLLGPAYVLTSRLSKRYLMVFALLSCVCILEILERKKWS